MEKRIFSAGPSLSSKEIDYVTDAVRNAWYEGAYAYIGEFEDAVAKYVGRKFALALPSGTSAIHLSLVAAGIKEGDEVIVPDFTWVGTSAPISYVGAKPVFVDVEPDTWCISAEEIKRHITDKTKAIYAVDIYGNMPDYKEIEKIASENNIILLEDAAEALGSSYKGKKAGAFGLASIFSFHGSKIITTGEGGMLLTDDESVYKSALKMANCGKDLEAKKMFWFDRIGFKYKYTSLQAAMGLAQIERIDDILEKRRWIFDSYREKLGDIEGVQINTPGDDVKSNYWMTTLVFDPKLYGFRKEDIVEYYKTKNIDCRPVMYQLSSMPAYTELKPEWDNPESDRISTMGINLPTPDCLTEDDIVRVVYELKSFLKNNRK